LAQEPKRLGETVAKEAHHIDEKRSAWAAGFAKHCTSCKLKRGRTEKTGGKALLTTGLWEAASAWIDLLPLLYKSWFRSDLHVEVSCLGFIAASTMFFLSNIGPSRKTQTLTNMFLQEKVDAAFNWIWESSFSA